MAEHYPYSVNVKKYGKRFLRNLKAIYEGKYKYIWASNGLHKLYDLEKDPGEEEHLIEKLPHKAHEMQRSLERRLGPLEQGDISGETVKIDESTQEKLRALGYIK